ncbi:MAG: SAM-dependent methyltransferase [Chitinophagaceae bacterium]|nr:SAM-dependent methyltransferase [Chitinophagaceae bacterium]
MDLSNKYWDARYAGNDISWDIGKISAPLKLYIDQLKNKEFKILIPGCGNSYEAEYFLQNGFSNITIIDFSKIITNKLQEKLGRHLGKGLTIICADFFEHYGQYDLIIEQTFFCAIDPLLRKNYVNKVDELLNENGKLVGLLFNRQFENNPPFGGNEEEYKVLFRDKFDIKRYNTEKWLLKTAKKYYSKDLTEV